MKVRALLAALSVGPLALASLAAQISAPSYRIAGTVVSRTDGHPLARARVLIVNVKEAKQIATVVTSDDGKYEFTGISAGKYSLTGAKRGYLPTGYDQHENFWTAIVTGAGLDTENLTLRLWPAAYITGKVLDENGDPVRNANVSLYSSLRRDGVSRIELLGSATTNDLGEYELGPQTTGEYFVAVKTMPWYAIHPVTRQAGAVELPTQVDSALDVAYPITYYGGSTDSDSATPIELHGGDRAQADIHLNPVPALHLFFHTPTPMQSNTNFSTPQLMQSTFGDDSYLPGMTVQPISAGTWEMTGVPAGRYSVRLAGNTGVSEQKQVDIVNDGDEVDTSSGVPMNNVTVHVSMSDGSSLPAQLFVALRRTNERRNLMAKLGPKNEAQLQQVPQGTYEVVAGSSGRQYSVAQITSSDAQVSGHLLNVPAGSNISASVILFNRTQSVQGFVQKEGKGFAGAMVILVPKDPATHPDLFRRDQSDLDGSFQVNGVVPGTYTILAIENGWDLDWMQPGILTPYMKGERELQVGGQHALTLPQPVEVQGE